MEKLIITVACDSRTSYPHNHLCPSQEDIPGVAQQYIDAVNAGAAIAHIHGRRTLEETIQADGRQVSRIHHDDWKRLQDAIMNKVDPIMQFGVASARIEEKIKLMELGPDMMAVCFNAHDEYFQPEPSLPPKRMMAIHPVEELMAYAKAAEEHTSGRTPTPRYSSAGPAAPGRRRPRALCSSWSIIFRKIASGT